MMNDGSWDMGWGMGGFGSIGALVVLVLVVGIAVLLFRRRSP